MANSTAASQGQVEEEAATSSQLRFSPTALTLKSKSTEDETRACARPSLSSLCFELGLISAYLDRPQKQKLMLVGGSCSTEKLVFHFSDSKRLWSEKHPVLTFRLGKIFSTVREVGCLVDVVVVVVVDVECRHRGYRRCRCRCTMLLLSPVPSVAVEV